MGIFDKLKAEFIDIIEWLDSSNDTMLYRFERYQNEIKYGAKLVVRESQVAVFINEGQVADVFQPGTYTLETKNVPILATLKGWKYGFNSPFKAEVYFASMRNFTDRKWGTKNPIHMRDPEFGLTRLRAFGSYAVKVKDPVKMIKEIAGTDSHFTTDEITDQLKSIIITRFTDALAESKIPAVDMTAKLNEFSKLIHTKVADEFGEYGLELTKFLVESISFPPEVEEAIDKRSSMGIIGNMNQYMQYQTANSVEAAAENPGGGAANEGMGMGMGFAMANQMAGMFQGNQQQAYTPQGFQQPYQSPQQQQQQPPRQQAPGPAGPPPIPRSVKFYAVVNGSQAGPFTTEVLRQMAQQGSFKPDTLVWKEGMAAWSKASTVAETSGLFAPQGPPPVPPM
ncbi:MAG: SPFH domain-containing protein [bacterium]|nr:SPFH domain-containing protein [bacterium]